MLFDVLTVGDTLHRYSMEHVQCRVHGVSAVVSRDIHARPFMGSTLQQLLKRNVLRTEVGVVSSYPDHRASELCVRTVVRRIMHRRQLVLLWESVTEWGSRHKDNSEVAQNRMSHRGWRESRAVDRPDARARPKCWIRK